MFKTSRYWNEWSSWHLDDYAMSSWYVNVYEFVIFWCLRVRDIQKTGARDIWMNVHSWNEFVICRCLRVRNIQMTERSWQIDDHAFVIFSMTKSSWYVHYDCNIHMTGSWWYSNHWAFVSFRLPYICNIQVSKSPWYVDYYDLVIHKALGVRDIWVTISSWYSGDYEFVMRRWLGLNI